MTGRAAWDNDFDGRLDTTFVSASVSANHTASWGEVVIADTSSNSITVTLPSPDDTGQVTLKKAASANTLTIARPSGQDIDGSASDIDLTTSDLVSRTIVSDGTDYWVI